MSVVKAVTVKTFEKEVLQSELPVLVDFWAPWCGPCRMIGPVVESLAAENEGEISVVKVNVDENQDLAIKYGVRGIPTLAFFKNGSEVKRIVGAQGKDQLQQAINEVINSV
ncbi:MAG: thioredoxin [Syntrophomonadaceae bacterium]|nr:thioredoxin [Syntrophomonadaceae bacterium]